MINVLHSAVSSYKHLLKLEIQECLKKVDDWITAAKAREPDVITIDDDISLRWNGGILDYKSVCIKWSPGVALVSITACNKYTTVKVTAPEDQIMPCLQDLEMSSVLRSESHG